MKRRHPTLQRKLCPCTRRRHRPPARLPPAFRPSSSAWSPPSSPAVDLVSRTAASRCWSRARSTRRGSTSPRGSTDASPTSRSRAARTSPPAPCWCGSTIPKRSPSTSRRWPPRSSPRRSSPTSTPARVRRSSRRARPRSSGRRPSVMLAQKTYDRVRQLAEHGNAPQARLDQATDALHESQRAGIRPNPPTSRRSTATRPRNVRSPMANVQKAIADIRRCNRSSTRW